MTDDRERDLAERIADTIREAHREWMRPGSGTAPLCDVLSAAVVPVVRASEAVAVRRALDAIADDWAAHCPDHSASAETSGACRCDDANELRMRAEGVREDAVALPAHEQGDIEAQLDSLGLTAREGTLRLLADVANTQEVADAYVAAADKERASTISAREQGGAAE